MLLLLLFLPILFPLSVSADCFNSVQDPTETDIDCGGTHCWSRCQVGDKCNMNLDCETYVCKNGICSEVMGRQLIAMSGRHVHNRSSVITLPYDEMNRAISVVALLLSFISFILGCKLANVLCKRSRPRPRWAMNRNGEIRMLSEIEMNEDEDEDGPVHV